MNRLGYIAILLLGVGCSGGPTAPDPIQPTARPTPTPITLTPGSPLQAPLEAQLLHDARVRLVSGTDEPQLVHVRWESALDGIYEQDWLVPARGIVEAYPDCFYGGPYRIGVLGYHISFERDYGVVWTFCY